VVDEIRRKNQREITVKIDFEKSNDLVNWDFFILHVGKTRFLSD